MPNLNGGGVVRVRRPDTGPRRVLVVRGPRGAAGDGDAVTHEELTAHVTAAEPHPQYDDLPDLSLTFENGLI